MKKSEHVQRTHPVKMDFATPSADDHEPFARRLGRAVLLLCVAVTTHVWLLRAPQGDNTQTLLPHSVAPAIAQAGMSFAPVASQPRTAEPSAPTVEVKTVQVKTEFVKVPGPVNYGIV